jgi:hypothetical protein
MSDWWEHAQPKGAKPAPLWLKAVFVVSLGALCAALYYASVEIIVVAASVSFLAMFKLMAKATQKLSGPEPPSWPTRPRDEDQR